jgi:hypothetical protein
MTSTNDRGEGGPDDVPAPTGRPAVDRTVGKIRELARREAEDAARAVLAAVVDALGAAVDLTKPDPVVVARAVTLQASLVAVLRIAPVGEDVVRWLSTELAGVVDFWRDGGDAA